MECLDSSECLLDSIWSDFSTTLAFIATLGRLSKLLVDGGIVGKSLETAEKFIVDFKERL